MPKYLEVMVRIPLREQANIEEEQLIKSLYISSHPTRNGVTVYTLDPDEPLVDSLGHIVAAEVVDE